MFVMPEASQLRGFVVMVWLYQGRRRPTFRLCGLTWLLSLPLLLLGSTANVRWMKVCLCYCVLKQYTSVSVYSTSALFPQEVLVPQDDRGSITSSLFHRVPCSSHETNLGKGAFFYINETQWVYINLIKRGDECYLPPHPLIVPLNPSQISSSHGVT